MSTDKIPDLPYVFVVGCPRSGTTLLQRMLDAHPMLAVANDTHFIPQAIEKVRAGDETLLSAERVEFVRNYKRTARLGIDLRAVDRAAAETNSYTEFVSALYAEMAKFHGKPLAGEKTPDYVRHIPLLHRLFPNARFVHIIRDGRDVALSTLQWAHEHKGPGRFDLWQDQPLAVCALWWAWQVGSGHQAGVQIGPRHYLELLYEDLTSEPETQLRRVSEFLDLPYAPEMVNFHAGKSRAGMNLSAKQAWLPATSGLRDWRKDLSTIDQALFDALSGTLLQDLGYQRHADAIDDDVALTAQRCQHWWQQEMLRRERKRSNRSVAKNQNDSRI